MASSLSLLLLSCSATRPPLPTPPSAQDLGRYVLAIERTPDGQVTHSWKPVQDVELAEYAARMPPRHLQGRVVQAAFTRDCEEERDACEAMCLAGLKGRNWSHMSAGSKKDHCSRVCRQPYLDCHRLKELAEGQAVKFHAIDEAVDWVRTNREKLLEGTVVVIAGAAFVVAVGASAGGVLLLVPVVALASSDAAGAPRALAVTP